MHRELNRIKEVDLIIFLFFPLQTILIQNIYRNPQNSAQTADASRCKSNRFVSLRGAEIPPSFPIPSPKYRSCCSSAVRDCLSTVSRKANFYLSHTGTSLLSDFKVDYA